MTQHQEGRTLRLCPRAGGRGVLAETLGIALFADADALVAVTRLLFVR